MVMEPIYGHNFTIVTLYSIILSIKWLNDGVFEE